MSADLRPIPFPIAARRDRFLFFDAFIRDRRLVLVSTYYPDVLFDFAHVDVRLDGTPLRQFEEIGRNEYEPTRAIVYPLDEVPLRGSHELTVRYESQTLAAPLVPQATAAKTFAVATLFREIAAVATFHRYYKQQGVERFYLFYNGTLPKVRQRLPEADDIVYGEWDFVHKLDRRSDAFSTRLVDAQAARNWHHAQTAFLTMVRHRFFPDCSFLAHVDLDEFLGVDGETLRAYVDRMDAPTVTAPCHWTEVRPLERWLRRRWWNYRSFRILLALGSLLGRIVRRPLGAHVSAPILDYDDLAHLWANAHSEGFERTKTIYRGDYDGLIGIHKPKDRARLRVSEELRLYHIVNTRKARQTRIHADAAPVSLIP